MRSAPLSLLPRLAYGQLQWFSPAMQHLSVLGPEVERTPVSGRVLARLEKRMHAERPEALAVLEQVSRRTDDGLGIDAYYNVECREGPKGSAVGAHLQLGKPLELSFMGAKGPGGAQQYEDLDEILARYAEPFGQHIKQIKGHR